MTNMEKNHWSEQLTDMGGELDEGMNVLLVWCSTVLFVFPMISPWFVQTPGISWKTLEN